MLADRLAVRQKSIDANSKERQGGAYHATGEEWLPWDTYHTRVAAIGAPPPTLVHIPTDLLARAAPEKAWITRENFCFNNIFDNTAARTDLGFRPAVALDAGVRRIAAWLDARDRIPTPTGDEWEDRLIAAWERHGAAFVAACQPGDAREVVRGGR